MVAPVPAQSSKPPPPVLPNRGRPQDKDYPTSRPQPKDLLPRPQSSQNSALKFTIDKRPDLGYHFVCYLDQTRHATPPLTPLDSALTWNVGFCTILVQISPLESALTDIPLLTPLESALTKIPGVGGTPTLSRLQRPASSIRPLEPYAPRGASIPCGLSRLRILPVTTGDSQRQIFRPSNVPALAAFAFNRLQPLSTKHPGYGVRFSLPPLATRHKAR